MSWAVSGRGAKSAFAQICSWGWMVFGRRMVEQKPMEWSGDSPPVFRDPSLHIALSCKLQRSSLRGWIIHKFSGWMKFFKRTLYEWPAGLKSEAGCQLHVPLGWASLGRVETMRLYVASPCAEHYLRPFHVPSLSFTYCSNPVGWLLSLLDKMRKLRLRKFQ